MSIDNIKPGNSIPNDINAIIEIPAFADPIKFEMDKESGLMKVDRFVGTSMRYPCNYGYIPNTLGEDGDPLDVLVITPYPLISGCFINCRPIGVLRMTDESGSDAKIMAVPNKKLTPIYNNVGSYTDLPELLLSQIVHFFEHYKDLEPGKWVKIDRWEGAEAAHAEILASIERFK